MRLKTMICCMLAVVMILSVLPVYASDSAAEFEAAVVTEPEDRPADAAAPDESAAEEQTPAGTDAEEGAEPAPEEGITPEFTPVPLRSDHDRYMSGYGNGKFGPNDSLTWAQACAVIYGILEDQSMGSEQFTFSDVTSGAWYYKSVSTLASRGILPCDGGALHPNDVITRGDFVRLVVRLTDIDPEAECSFSDLSPEDACYAAVATAVARGWVHGMPDGTFGPGQSLTRAAAVTIINGVLGRTGDKSIFTTATNLRAFDDVPANSWFYGAVMEATIDHTGQVDEDGTEHWTSYTPAYLVQFSYSGIITSEMVYAGDCPVHVPAVNLSGTVITRWIFPSGVMLNPKTTKIYGPTFYTAWYAPALITEHTQYITGFDDGTVRPDNDLTRAEAAQMFYGLLQNQSKGGYPSAYNDVPGGAWYTNAVQTLASRGLLTAGGDFRPNDVMTRGEFVEMVTRLLPWHSGEVSFRDVSKDDPYYSAIAAAVSKGWIYGYSDGTFGSNDPLTRASAIAIFNRILGRKGDTQTGQQMDSRYVFSDLPKSHWAYSHIMEAATEHAFTWSAGGEAWSTYSHKITGTVDWTSSASVVAASSITNSITPTYSGNFDHNYNWDYSQAVKENYVKNYTSSTKYLIWISLQNQKVYIFTGSKGNWTLSQTFLGCSGAPSTPTPTGVTQTTYKQKAWYFGAYTVAPVVRFYSTSRGFAFHSQLYYPNSSRLMDDAIGYPASHGCIRMLQSDIDYIYNYIPNGTTVIVY